MQNRGLALETDESATKNDLRSKIRGAMKSENRAALEPLLSGVFALDWPKLRETSNEKRVSPAAFRGHFVV